VNFVASDRRREDTRKVHRFMGAQQMLIVLV